MYENEDRELKKRSERFSVNLNSVITSGFRNYLGFIENVSEEGLAYIRVERDTFNLTLKEFTPEKIINIILVVADGETLNLNCQIKWSSLLSSPWPLPQDYPTLGLGMKIIDPPKKYREYLETLH
jgi:hypothetical protein